MADPPALTFAVVAEVRERALDGLAQHGERREGSIEKLDRAQREVAGYRLDLAAAGAKALAQIVDRDHQLRRIGAVHPLRRVDGTLSKVIDQSLAQRRPSRLLHVDEEVAARLLGAHRSTPMTSRTRTHSCGEMCG